MTSFFKSRKYNYILVLLILFYTHNIKCQTNQLNLHDDTNSNCNRSLPMNVEWVLQGFSLGFTGFFVEYLGLSSSIVQLLPHSTLQKSSYRKTFNESYFTTEYSTFSKELFPKEAKNIEYLISRSYSRRRRRSNNCSDCSDVGSSIDDDDNNHNNNSDYHPSFLYSHREQSIIKPSICIDFKRIIDNDDDDQYNSTNTTNETGTTNDGKYLLTNTALIGGDLARGYVSLNETKSAFECCEYCYSNILCLSWTFDTKTGIEIECYNSMILCL